MAAKRVELSPQKRKALYIILKECESGIKGIYISMKMSRMSLFYKLKGEARFKEEEYRGILNIVGITDEELEDFSENSIIKFLLKKGM